jgi:bla regulator protein blaR1
MWLAGVAVALGRIAASWINIVRLLRLARPASDHRVLAIVKRVVNEPHAVTVLELNGLMGPICWQMHRPKIILPADTHQLSDTELEMMIQHELAHVRRSDPSLLFVQRLVEVFYWFNPLVWWMALQTARYREFMCDDLVVTSGYRRKDYAECLGKLAVWYYAPFPMAPVGLGMLWGQHLVLQRVRRLVQTKSEERSTLFLQRAAYCGIAITMILIIALLRIKPDSVGLESVGRWTAWPPWTARALDTVGIRVRDYPLDSKRCDPEEVWQEVRSRRMERGVLKR